MLWLGLYFPELPLEVFAPQDTPAVSQVVTERGRHAEQVLRCNAAAHANGVRPGLRLQSALALEAALQVYPRDRAREQAALQRLAYWALQFSSQISFEPSLILLEIGASLRLFHGLENILERVRRESSQLGHRMHWGVAPTPMAAALLARACPSQRATDIGRLRDMLQDISLDRLTRNTKARRLLRDIGLRSIGECLGLPRPELARRLGPELLQLFDRLLGTIPDPRDTWQPPSHFEQTIELQAQITQHAALVFPARRMLLALCGFLRGRGMATQRLEWSLQHRDESPDTCFRQGLLQPSRDSDHLLTLFRERIERVRLDAPVTGLHLRVDDCLDFAECSGSLFECSGQAGDDLLERLGSRLGPQQVRGLGTRADHRPEHSVALCAPGQAGIAEPPAGELPVWLLPEPHPLSAYNGVPHHGGPLQLQDGVRRIESGWWDGQDVARDYYQALSPVGDRLWVFRDRRSGRWFLHGLFA